jgi:hypothetical protein
MKHIKLWENFQNSNFTLKIGLTDRWKNYDIFYYNVWLDGEKIMDALSGPAWREFSDEMGWLNVMVPTDNQKVAYVVSMSLPQKYRDLGLLDKIHQNLANELGKEIRNPREDANLSEFFNKIISFNRYWELRRDLPFFPDNQFQKDF